MHEPTLVILAAGLGSRYGGLKQMDPLGPDGESIIDYSVFDAAEAGFSRVLFVLREEIVDDFYSLFANRYRSRIQVDHVIQRLSDIPTGIQVNPDRKKPWGTGHAMLSAREKLDTPFAVINGDDFYGREAFNVMAEFLNARDPNAVDLQAMVGYTLQNTLSEHGYVSRGICDVDTDDLLMSVTERTHIERYQGSIRFLDEEQKSFQLTGQETVSMNFWGFTPAILPHFQRVFTQFMEERGFEIKSEFYIPFALDQLIDEGITHCQVLRSDAKWFGVTYQEDKPQVTKQLQNLQASGRYPGPLWSPTEG